MPSKAEPDDPSLDTLQAPHRRTIQQAEVRAGEGARGRKQVKALAGP